MSNYQIWLSKDILNWEIEARESYSVTLEEWKRAYDILYKCQDKNVHF